MGHIEPGGLGLHREGASRDLAMEQAFDVRVEQQCRTLGTDERQLEDILLARREERTRPVCLFLPFRVLSA
jgi:hypothetical protein